jgi:hypothetical protein
MEISTAQEDVRRVFRSGAVGQLVSAAVWAAAAATATWGAPATAPYVLFFGGILIFPLTSLALLLLRGPASLPRGHPMSALAFQLAMQVPLGLLVALALNAFAPKLFFPAAMVLVGGHYLAFVFLYGMRSFAILAAALIATGVVIGVTAPALALAGAWLAVVFLLAFSVFAFAGNLRTRQP